MAWTAWGRRDQRAWYGWCPVRIATALDLLAKVGEKIKYGLQGRAGINEVGQQAMEVEGKGFPEMIQIQLS